MDCLPDLLSKQQPIDKEGEENELTTVDTLCSREMPCFLIGLKTDLTSECQVDPQLGCDLASLFDVQGMELSALADTVQVDWIYHALVRITSEQTTYLGQPFSERSKKEGHEGPVAKGEEAVPPAEVDSAATEAKETSHKTQYHRHTSPPATRTTTNTSIPPSSPPPIITKRASEPILMDKASHKVVRSAPSSPQLQRSPRRTSEGSGQVRRRKSERRLVAASVVRRGSSRIVNSIRRRRSTPSSPCLSDILDCVLCSEEDPDGKRCSKTVGYVDTHALV